MCGIFVMFRFPLTMEPYYSVSTFNTKNGRHTKVSPQSQRDFFEMGLYMLVATSAPSQDCWNLKYCCSSRAGVTVILKSCENAPTNSPSASTNVTKHCILVAVHKANSARFHFTCTHAHSPGLLRAMEVEGENEGGQAELTPNGMTLLHESMIQPTCLPKT